MEENNINLCRLCFDEGNINIFDENGQMLEISTIIRQHLDDEVRIISINYTLLLL